MKKKYIILLLCAVFTLSAFGGVSAQTLDETFGDFYFKFPEQYVISDPVSANDDGNIVSLVDDNWTAIALTYSDSYYQVTSADTPAETKKLERKYKKEDVWLGCDLFEDTWNNEQYVYDYLCGIVNQEIQYTCSIERVTVDTLDFFKFSFYLDDGTPDPPGGYIYLSMYKSNLYILQFCNFVKISVSKIYADTFEQTLAINGVEKYGFVTFTERSMLKKTVTVIGVGVVIAAAVFIASRKKRGENEEHY